MTDKQQIEEMAKIIASSCYKSCSECNSQAIDGMACIEVRSAEALYNAGYRKQEWISVEERLPDPSKNVLVCKTFLDKHYIDIGCVKDAETCYCASDEFIIKPWLHKLTHWMPLPEPPKGE